MSCKLGSELFKTSMLTVAGLEGSWATVRLAACGARLELTRICGVVMAIAS